MHTISWFPTQLLLPHAHHQLVSYSTIAAPCTPSAGFLTIAAPCTPSTGFLLNYCCPMHTISWFPSQLLLPHAYYQLVSCSTNTAPCTPSAGFLTIAAPCTPSAGFLLNYCCPMHTISWFPAQLILLHAHHPLVSFSNIAAPYTLSAGFLLN